VIGRPPNSRCTAEVLPCAASQRIPSLAQRLQAAESALAIVQAEQRAVPSARPLIPNVREHYLKVADRLSDLMLHDPERGRETLREVLGERIKLKPDTSGQFL
jgi:hypothetical protein